MEWLQDQLVGWNVGLQILTQILIAATIITSLLTVFAGKISGQRQERVIARLTKDNLDRQEEVAELKMRAADSETARMKMESELEGTKQNTIKALNTAIREGWEREFRDKALMPREINHHLKEQYIERLKAFAGTPYCIVSLPETEPARFARSIEKLLHEAKWNRMKPIELIAEDYGIEFSDGVDLESNGSVIDAVMGPPRMEIESILVENEIGGVHRSWPTHSSPGGEIDDGVVKIIVGLKHQWAFDTVRHDTNLQMSKRQEEFELSSQPCRDGKHINMEQWRQLSALLSSGREWPRVVVFAGSVPFDSLDVARQLHYCLNEAGIEVVRRNHFSVHQSGLTVIFKEGDAQGEESARDFIEMLQKCGIPASITSVDVDVWGRGISIIVGKF